MIVRKGTRPIQIKDIIQAYNTANNNTAVTIRSNGVTDRFYALHKIVWSYNGTPTGGGLMVQEFWNNNNNSANLFEVDITAGGPGGLNMNLDLTVARDLLVTLKAAGGAVIGKLNIEYSVEM